MCRKMDLSSICRDNLNILASYVASTAKLCMRRGSRVEDDPSRAVHSRKNSGHTGDTDTQRPRKEEPSDDMKQEVRMSRR